MTNVREIFFEAMDVPAIEREAFLDWACGENPVLRSEVEALLRNWEAAGTFMEASVDLRLAGQTPNLRSEPTQEGNPRGGHDAKLADRITLVGRLPGGGGAALPTVAGYELLAVLGRGGMGVVYAAHQVGADRIVALKTIGAGQDEPTRERFRREAEAAARLRHPGVVEIFDVGEAEVGPYFSMEYCPDGNLDDYLLGRPLDGPAAARLVSSLGRAVGAAHDSGLLHRDIKPANVLLARRHQAQATVAGNREDRRPLSDFEPKLTDFGLAKRVGDDKLTQTGMLLGTPPYMSPEQASGALDLGPASDVYALGAVLYECLTGRPPFLGATPVLTIAMVIEQEVVPPRRLQPGLAKDLETICRKCLHKDPSRRYSSAGELADDLDRFLAGRPITARPAGPIERMSRWVRRNAVVTAAAAAVVLSLIAGVIVSAAYAMAAAQERDLKDDALRAKSVALTAESEQRQQAERALAVSDAIRNLLLEDLIGQANVRYQMNRLRAEGRQDAFDKDPRVSELLNRAAESLTESRIEERFPAQPLVQADILYSVGRAYAAVGDLKQAVKHLERSEQLLSKHAGNDSPKTLICRNSLGITYADAGRFDKAIPLLENTRKLMKRKLGEDHPDTLAAYGYLAMAYTDAGRFDEAITIYEGTLKQMEVALGEDHRYTLTTRTELAGVYLKAGRLDEVIPIYETTLKMMKRMLGEDHPDTLFTRSNLANVYSELGRLSEAIPLYETTLELMQRKLSQDHPNISVTRSNLAVMYIKTARFDEAIPLLETTLKLQEAKLGEDHPNSLATRNNLAIVYIKTGELEKAVSLFETTLKVTERKLGKEHPDTLSTCQNLARAYLQVERIGEAIALLEATLKVMERKLGKEHPKTLNTRTSLAEAYLDAGQIEEALPLLEATLRVQGPQLGQDHPKTLTTCTSLARAYMEAGRIDEAIPILETTFQLMTRKLGKDHPSTLIAHTNLAGAYMEAGRIDEAIPLFEAKLKLLEPKLGTEHPDILSTRIRMAEAFIDAGRITEAVPLLEATLKLMEPKLGTEHPSTLEARTLLAHAYGRQGMTEASLGLLERVVESKERIQGEDHPDTLVSRYNLANALKNAGKLDEALPLFESAYIGMKKRDRWQENTLLFQSALIEAYGEAARFTKQEVLLRDQIGLFKSKTPDGESDIASVQIKLARCLMHQGKYAEAEQFARSAWRAWRESAPGSWQTAETESILGDALLSQGKYTEAEKHLTAGYAGLKNALAATHSQSPTAVRDRTLCDALNRLVRLAEATESPDKEKKWRSERSELLDPCNESSNQPW